MAEERRIFSKQGLSAPFFCCRYFVTDTFNDCKAVIFAGSITAKVTAFSARFSEFAKQISQS